MYEFTEDCMIHIPQIDEEHRKLFQMINVLIELILDVLDVQQGIIEMSIMNVPNVVMDVIHVIYPVQKIVLI